MASVLRFLSMKKPPTSLKRDHNSAFVRWKGKRIYFGRWGSIESQQDFAAWLKTISSHPDISSPKHQIMIAECVEKYQRFADGYYPKQEALNVRAAMASLLKFAGEDRAVNFGPRLLKDFQRALATKANDDGSLKYARTTVNSRVDKVRRCLRWCASEELIPVDVVTALDTVPGIPSGRGMARESAKVLPVDLSEVQKTLPFLSPTVAAMVQVQYLCGMRPQDVCGMTTAGIDTSGETWIYRPAKHKNSHRGQNLAKGIPDAARSILEPLLRENHSEPIFSPIDSKRFYGNAGKSSRRTPYSTASYGKAIASAILKASESNPKVTIAHWRPNQLRHSIATSLRERLGIEAAQDYLGHSKPDTTIIYAEQTERNLAETAKAISSPFLPVEHLRTQPGLPAKHQ